MIIEEKMFEKRVAIKDNGWKIEDFENIGLIEFFRDTDILSYQINRCSLWNLMQTFEPRLMGS